MAGPAPPREGRGAEGVFRDALTGRGRWDTPVAGAGERPAGYVAVVLPLPGLAAGLADTYRGPPRYPSTVRDASGHWRREACLHSGGRTPDRGGDVRTAT